MQPAAAPALPVPARPLEQRTVHLDPGRVDEHRNAAPRLHLARHHQRRHSFGEPPRRLPQSLDVHRAQPCQPLPRAARLRNAAQPERRPRHRVGAQRVEVRQRTVAPRQAGDDRPQRLRVRRAAVAHLHPHRFVEQLEQTVPPGRPGENRGAAAGGQVQVHEVHLDLRRADLPLAQGSPPGCPSSTCPSSHARLVPRAAPADQPNPYQGIRDSGVSSPSLRAFMNNPG